MKNPVAKHMNTYNKPSVIPDKREMLQQKVDEEEMEDSTVEGIDLEMLSLECFYEPL